jgi:hypothetical protein
MTGKLDSKIIHMIPMYKSKWRENVVPLCIKIKVWGLKAWIPAIFHDFFHIEDDVILIFLKMLTLLS